MREILRNFAMSLSRIEKIRLKTIFSLLLLALLANPSLMLISAVTATRATHGTVAIINAADGTSNFNFTTAQQNVGDTFVINVTITGALDVGSWQVTIQWDSSMLDFVVMTLPSDNIFADENPIVSPVINSTRGSVCMGATATGQGFSGDGTIAQLTLEITKAPVSGPSIQTDINFEGVGIDTFLQDSNLTDVSGNYAWSWAHYEYSLYGYSGPPGPTLVHDVAVTSVLFPTQMSLSPSVGNGSSLDISVTVLNTGDYTENIEAAIFVNSTSAAPNETIASLGPGLSSTLPFAWNTTGWALGDYVLSATAYLPGDPTPTDNTLIYPYGVIHLISSAPSGPPPVPVHDIGVMGITILDNQSKPLDPLLQKYHILSGSLLTVIVTVQDNGNFPENFTVNLFANSINVAPYQTVTDLNPGSVATLSFVWNTTGWALGDYIVNATAYLAGDPTPNDNTIYYHNEVGYPTVIHLFYGPSGINDVTIAVIFRQDAYLNPIVLEGSTQSFVVDMWNTGDLPESFDVGLSANSTIVAPNQTVTNLASGNQTALTFVWNTTGWALGDYVLSATAYLPGDPTPADNNASTTILIRGPLGPTDVHDVYVTGIEPLSNNVVIGSSLTVFVGVQDNGSFPESVAVGLFANSTIVAPNQTVALSPGFYSTTGNFVWNTTGWALGDYVLSATAYLPGDPTPSDNTQFYEVIHVITVEAANELLQHQNQNATLFPDPSMVQSTNIGQNFTVSINISDVYNLGEWEIGVVFNSSLLKLTGFYEGEFMKSANLTAFSTTTYTDPNNPSDSTPIASDWIGFSPGLSGSGQLAYLTFTSVGIGVSNIQLVDASLMGSEWFGGTQGYIPFDIVESFAVPFNGTMIAQVTAHLVGATNGVTNGTVPSGLFNTTFSVNNKEISFDVLTAKNWSLQVSVPKELLTCNLTSQWTIKVDGTPIPYTATETATTTELSFQRDEGNHTVEIIGTRVLGEDWQSLPPTQSLAPPSLLVAVAASLCIATLLLALVDLKKTRSFRAPKEFDPPMSTSSKTL